MPVPQDGAQLRREAVGAWRARPRGAAIGRGPAAGGPGAGIHSGRLGWGRDPNDDHRDGPARSLGTPPGRHSGTSREAGSPSLKRSPAAGHSPSQAAGPRGWRSGTLSPRGKLEGTFRLRGPGRLRREGQRAGESRWAPVTAAAGVGDVTRVVGLFHSKEPPAFRFRSEFLRRNHATVIMRHTWRA